MITLLLAALCRASAWTAGPSFTMSVSPACLGGEFVWTNSCCPVVGSGLTFTYSCDGSCRCTGCAATGYYTYEGYRLPATGGACGCGASGGYPPSEDDDTEPRPLLPGATATFSKRVIFFEDEYDNAPGERVPWRSTETVLDCRASGGVHGGRARIEIAGADGLVPYGGSPLSFERELEPGETVAFKNTYRAARPSGGADDIVATATFEENVTGWTWTSESKATAVKLRFRPQVSAPENDCEGRHRYGARELVDCIQMPSAPRVAWTLTAGEIDETAQQYKQAGILKTLSRVNSSGLFVDDPSCGWSDGRIVMATPFGWNETGTRGEPLPYKMFATEVRATLDLQSNGTFRVEKLGNTIIRQVGGEVILNGVREK